MADLATLRDLRDRLANATGPDRRLDHDLMALSYVKGERSIGTMEDDGTGWRPCTDFVWIDPETNRWKTTARDGFEYTASIDAAVALCTRVLPGWMWRIAQCSVSDDASVEPDFNHPIYGAELQRVFGDDAMRGFFDVYPGCDIDQRPPGQPALALCRAIVGGLIAQEEANG